MKVLIAILLLSIPAIAQAQILCLVDFADSDGSGFVNINDQNYVKAKLGTTEVPADVAGATLQTCNGIVNINDLNYVKAQLGKIIVWHTVGTDSYDTIACPNCLVFQEESQWLSANANRAQTPINIPCVPIHYPPDNRIYSANTGNGFPSYPTGNLNAWFWGNAPTSANPTWFTYCEAVPPL